MGRRATLETADAPFVESCKGAVGSRKTHEYNIFDHGLQRRERLTMLPSRLVRKVRAACPATDGPAPRAFERLIVAVRHCANMPRQDQCSAPPASLIDITP